ncbi:PQQ-binding-like beta-propeller repeat protein [Prosthecobacter sp.]|uniref:outer membrane protein assembly factor BamB family protein n=1 Tax=Prosthecobacter sp. TaxID=1965333 RepID=UPI001D2E113F|nr:PQQ-binding-like beta-propeller repeat protein [Prosthecobacter sp.]MCB1278947.1 PQQ-binding-like beta-propeller repeat protein [Prosthecobacter sp.]
MRPLLFLLALSTAHADWPTYLHDASRVGATTEEVKLPLQPAWTFESPTAPKMAWAGEDGRVIEGHELFNRIRFDDVFHVAISDGRVYFGSSVDGRILCRDLATGLDKWSFFTNAPVRLAPTIANGKVYVGSDDGYAYCLDAKSGTLVWKLRAGPHDERILARGRMISRWPVRTGLLVDDGIAYFGAGVFPHEKVFIYAVDAATGKVIWKNDAISEKDAGRNDLSPQGYLLATKDILFVPSGRSLAESIDRKTGEPIAKAEPSWRGDAGGPIGGTQAFLADDQIYAVGEHHILALDQEKQKSGFGWFNGTQMTLAGDMAYMANGVKITAVDRIKHAEGTRIRHAHEMAIAKLSAELKKHPALAEAKKFQAAESATRKVKEAAEKDPTPENQAALQKAQTELAAVAAKYEPLRLAYKAKQDESAKHKADLAQAADVGVKWSIEAPHEAALVLAGKTLFAGGKDEVIGIDTETGKIIWKAPVKGLARGLAVSDGHLVVSTTTGQVHVFGEKAVEPIAEKKSNDFPSDAAHAKAAEAILKQTGIRKGFCIVLGNDKGALAYELAKRSELIIFGVDADEKKVAESRLELLATGLYGPRITVDHLDLAMMPYSSYCANLIVSDSEEPVGVPVDVARHLKPIGGKFCFKASPKTDAWLAETKLTDEKAKIATKDGWSVLTRATLPGAGAWSHQYGNAANTSSTDDRRIKGGLSVLWYGDPGPGQVINRHDGAVGPISTNGRLFVQGQDSVLAYDAYNGQFLWETKNPGAMRTGVFNAREPGNMAASDDHLFMLMEDECIQFDAETGKIVRTLKIPGAGTKKDLQWGYIAYADGLLYGTETERVEKASEVARRGKSGSISTDRIFAYDVKSGALKWSYQGKHIAHQTVAIGDGSVFFIDASLTPEQRQLLLAQDKTELAKLEGKDRELAEDRIKNNDLRLAVALNAKTGKQLWAKPVDVTDCSEIGIGGGALTLMYHNGHIVLGGANANGHYWEQFLKGEFARRRLVVLDANKGDKLWAKDANYRHRPVVIDNEIIAEPWSYDLYTGMQKMRTHPITGEQTAWMFARPGHHCGAISATPNMMFFRSKFTAFYDRDSDSGTEHFAGHRLGCWINTIPANGLVMIPEASAGCVCLFSIASTVVFEPRDDRMNWGVYSADGASLPVQHMALNLGAPGDRRDAHGKLWLGYPRPSSRAGIDLPLDFKSKDPAAKAGIAYSYNEESHPVSGHDTPWIFTSGLRGLTRLEIPVLAKDQPSATYTVKLMFTALEDDKPGKRVFDVKLGDKVVLKSFDPATRKGAVVEEFTNIPATENLVVELIPASPDMEPLLNGLEILRTNAKEITGGVAER